MPLAPGTKLGPYEIESLLGAGGMGEVYRARDARLGREVALKILPQSFAADSDRSRRFEQEARAIGALNHPNILSVYDVGLENGTYYIVTELLQGTSLREKLDAGPLTPRRAVDYAIHIAQGLAAAHEKDIVHRDLKPENLFITRDGHIKILDFGLAKQTVGTMEGGDDLATLANSVETTAGMVLGTVGYMSPEQVRGETVGHRSDIFAFGAILYEMLGGQRAFKRNSAPETMTAILREEPPEIPNAAERQISPGVQRIVHRCLEKEAAQRFQSAKDLGYALESISVGSTQMQRVGTLQTPGKGWRVQAVVFAVSVLASAVWTLRGGLFRSGQPEYRQLTFRQGYLELARFAPGGENIVYAAAWDSPQFKLYSSRVDGTQVRELELPPAELMSVSRSGELAILLGGQAWNGIGGKLARAPLQGGAPRELLDNVIAADWSPDGSQLAVAHFANGKCRLEYPIGKSLYETTGYIDYVRFSPQGDAIAFMEHPLFGDDRGNVAVVDLQGHSRKLTQEWEGEQGLAWSVDGAEVRFTATNGLDTDRALYAVTRSGKQHLVLREPGGLYLDDIAPDGSLLFTHNERRYEVTAGEIGGQARQLNWMEILTAGSISRDGKIAIVTDMSGASGLDYGVYLVKLDGSPAVLLGSGTGGGISGDNKWVTSILPSDRSKILLLPTGVGETKVLTAPAFHYHRSDWASDGHTLVVWASEGTHPLRFWAQDVSSQTPRAITPEGVNGLFLNVNHTDYVCTQDSTGTVTLYPIGEGETKQVTVVAQSDQILGGSTESEYLYVTPRSPAVPLRVYKVNIKTGQRQVFASLAPKDLTGLASLFNPLFAADDKHYVYSEMRAFSVLYVGSGVK